MSKWIWTGLFKAIAEIIRKLLDRRSLGRTRDAQERNDALDRGPADDVIARLRHGTNGQRNPRGSVPDADDDGSKDTRG